MAQSADRRRGTNRVPNFTNRFNCRRSYDIRLFDDLLWWPVLDIDNAPRAAEEFLNGLADGEYKSLGILHYYIAPYWSSAKPTFKEAFQHLTKCEVSRTTEEKQVALALRGAAEAMICEGALYVLAGTPMYFACASTLLGNRELSVEVGPSSLKDLPNTGNHIVGPQAEKRKRGVV